MRNSPAILKEAQRYVEFRFAGSVNTEHLGDDNHQLGLLFTNANDRSCAIEIYSPNDTASIFAGPIRYETLEGDDGIAAVLWILDLLMTYPIYQLRSLVGQRGVVEAAGLSRRQMLWVKNLWPAWSGEVRSRQSAAEAFGHPEAYGPPRLRSFQASLF